MDDYISQVFIHFIEEFMDMTAMSFLFQCCWISKIAIRSTFLLGKRLSFVII